ncbi:ABC transporter permease [Aestuariimicrobium kwangyangense]|uniref:ABC transporter permease n=1 Tax=Aestuariimicrobium kwangyangense TaxID=396389 RepID=UPI0003B56308|nr:ABC transporter permease [Aestuariimicrobium kwangyangense]
MSLDFAPAPGAAPTRQRIVRHATLETLMLVRNGEQLLLALVIPAAVLLVGRWFPSRLGVDFTLLVPSVLGLALFSTGFTSVAIGTGFDRRYGVLERLASTPLGRTGMVIGKASASVVVSLAQVVLLVSLSLALGWRPRLDALGLLLAVPTMLAAQASFVAAALVMASLLRAEITLALANLVYLALAAGGALVVPAGSYGFLEPAVRCLPTAALGEGLRQGLADAPASGGWWVPLVVALVWAVAAVLLARKVMRWTS